MLKHIYDLSQHPVHLETRQGEKPCILTCDGSADGNSNRCPESNKLAAKTAMFGCPECGSGEMT